MFKKNILKEKYNNNHKHRCHYTNTFISHMDLEKNKSHNDGSPEHDTGDKGYC